MECLALVVVFIVMTIGIPMYRMLTGKGANNWRRLVRVDLAALLVITAGCAAALAIVRWFELGEAICMLTVVLPLMLCFAWLARYVIEDTLSRRRKVTNQKTDLSFLRGDTAPHEIVAAEAVDEAPEPRDV
jgi:hypothetical protein